VTGHRQSRPSGSFIFEVKGCSRIQHFTRLMIDLLGLTVWVQTQPRNLMTWVSAGPMACITTNQKWSEKNLKLGS